MDEFEEQLNRDIKTLSELAETSLATEGIRLKGKIEGLKLALSKYNDFKRRCLRT